VLTTVVTSSTEKFGAIKVFLTYSWFATEIVRALALGDNSPISELTIKINESASHRNFPSRVM